MTCDSGQRVLTGLQISVQDVGAVDVLEAGKELVHEPLVMHRLQLQLGVDDVGHGRVAAGLYQIDFVEVVGIDNVQRLQINDTGMSVKVL